MWSKPKPLTGAAAAEATTYRTPNPECPACQRYRQHTAQEWAEYHPHAGEGSIHDVNELKKSRKK